MMQQATLRGCSSCVARRVQQQSISTFVKRPQQPQQLTNVTRGRQWHATSRSSQNSNNSSQFSNNRVVGIPRKTTLSTKRRAATLAGSSSNGNKACAKLHQQQSPLSSASSLSRKHLLRPKQLRRELTRILKSMLGQPRTIPVPRWVSPKHYSITLSECCGHASFILVAISYAVDDFLWLRIIAVAGSTSMLFFTYFHPHGRVLWLPFKWNLLFIAINSYRIGKVLWDQHLAEQLSTELHETRETFFPLMDPVEFARLARAGTVEVFSKGQVVMEQDQPNSAVRVVLSGGLRVERDGLLTYKLDEGMFVSESGLHAGLLLPGSVESCCKIIAESDVRLLTWDRTELVDLLHGNPQMRRALKAVLSWDIVRKLKAQRIMLSTGLIADAEQWTERRHQQTEHRYTAILKNVLSHDPAFMRERKKELNKYRTIHHIDDEHHKDALKECGWTVEEYEQGYLNNNADAALASKLKRQHGPDWYLRQLIIRIVG